jgi:hypothetical protein
MSKFISILIFVAFAAAAAAPTVGLYSLFA